MIKLNIQIDITLEKSSTRGKRYTLYVKHLGRPLLEILRKAQISSSIEKIDSSMIVKLISLCINKDFI